MEKRELTAIILVIIVTIVLALIIIVAKSIGEKNTIVLLARAPEKGNWSPRTIEIEKGERVDLTIRNVDIVRHGFYVPALNIIVKDIEAGEVRKLNFTVDKEGEYLFLCNAWCSDYHMQMRGRIIVK